MSPELPPGIEPTSAPNRKKFKFETLTEVGMFFDLPVSETTKGSAQSACSQYGKKLNAKFKFGLVKNDQGEYVGIVRFWRAA